LLDLLERRRLFFIVRFLWVRLLPRFDFIPVVRPEVRRPVVRRLPLFVLPPIVSPFELLPEPLFELLLLF
jgi:hypothetical protein